MGIFGSSRSPPHGPAARTGPARMLKGATTGLKSHAAKIVAAAVNRDGRKARRTRPARLLLEALDEPAQQPHPDFVLADRVLDAVLEVGIVVDLHDDDAVFGLLEVDAVKSLADRARGAHRDVDHLARRLIEIKRAESALARGAVGAVLHHLPVAARHAVLAREQRLTGQHADAPVEFGR